MTSGLNCEHCGKATSVSSEPSPVASMSWCSDVCLEANWEKMAMPLDRYFELHPERGVEFTARTILANDLE